MRKENIKSLGRTRFRPEPIPSVVIQIHRRCTPKLAEATQCSVQGDCTDDFGVHGHLLHVLHSVVPAEMARLPRELCLGTSTAALPLIRTRTPQLRVARAPIRLNNLLGRLGRRGHIAVRFVAAASSTGVGPHHYDYEVSLAELLKQPHAYPFLGQVCTHNRVFVATAVAVAVTLVAFFWSCSSRRRYRPLVL